MEGFISVNRKILDWEWYTDNNVKSLFIHCLIKANFKAKNWRGQKIERGQFITSYNNLSIELNLSVKQIRLAFDKLKSTDEIITLGTNKNTVVTVVKYDYYQIQGQTKDKQKADKRQTKDTQRATTNNDNKDNNVNNDNKITLLDRDTDFKKSLQPFLQQYGADMLNDFYLYWTEKNPNGKKMRFEMQRTFSIKGRLARWNKNNFNNKNNGKSITGNNAKPTLEELHQKHQQYLSD